MNSNPKPNIKVYVTIQLCEPYAELHYIARRLKHYKVISKYRLDENWGTQIALSPTTQSFKFTGLDQLAVIIPPQMDEEIKYRRAQIQQNEEKSRNLNLEKARKARPNLPTSQQTSSGAAPSTRPPLSGSNSVPVRVRASPPSGYSQGAGPGPAPSTGPPLQPPPVPTYQQPPNSYQASYSSIPWNPQPSNQHPSTRGQSQHQPIKSYPSQYQSYKSPVSYQQSYQNTSPSSLRTKSVKRPNQQSQSVSPPQNGHPVTARATFRFPPPSSHQEQSPQFLYPQSYWTTPPPGVGVYTGVSSSAGSVTADTRPQSRVINSSESHAHQAGFWMDEVNYENLWISTVLTHYYESCLRTPFSLQRK